MRNGIERLFNWNLLRLQVSIYINLEGLKQLLKSHRIENFILINII